MHVVQILSSCPGVNAALAIDSTGTRPTLRSANYPYDPTTLWLIDKGFASDGRPLGVVIQHMNSGLYLVAQPNGGLVLGPVQQLDGWSTWTFGWGTGTFAIRPLNDANRNLNVLGGCGNTTVGLWAWGGGQKNETWRFTRPTAPLPPPPVRYKIQSGCADFKGNHLGIGLGANSPVALGSPNVEDLIWNVELAFTAANQLQDGVAIFNVKNRQALRCMGSDTRAGFSGNLDKWSLWTFGGGGPYVAVRPMADDDQNLNVEGGCGGGNTPVCTWHWSGGDPHEVWSFVRLS